MPSSVDQVRESLLALLPRGLAWSRQVARLEQLLEGWAVPLAELDCRAEDLVREANPATTLEILPDWERVAGLPTACLELAETVPERRIVLQQRLAGPVGQSIGFYYALAESLGFTIAIHEHRPFQAGPSSGDPMLDGQASKAGDRLTNGDWIHHWIIDAPGETVRRFKAGSSAGEPLATHGNTLLECVFTEAKPSHTSIEFRYGEDAEPPMMPVAYEPGGGYVGACWEVDHNWRHAARLTANTLEAVQSAALDRPPESGAVYSYELASDTASEEAEYVLQAGERDDVPGPIVFTTTLWVRQGTAPDFWVRLYNRNLFGLAPDPLIGEGKFSWMLGQLQFDGSPMDGQTFNVGDGWWRLELKLSSDQEDAGPIFVAVQVPAETPYASRTLDVVSGTVCKLIGSTPT